jgi:hypothetical protein
VSALRRSELLDTSVGCAHPPHAIKVFEVGLGEKLFSLPFLLEKRKGRQKKTVVRLTAQ